MKLYVLAMTGLLGTPVALADTPNPIWGTPDGTICLLRGKFSERHVIQATREGVTSYGIAPPHSNSPEWSLVIDSTRREYRLHDTTMLFDCMQAGVSVRFPT